MKGREIQICSFSLMRRALLNRGWLIFSSSVGEGYFFETIGPILYFYFIYFICFSTKIKFEHLILFKLRFISLDQMLMPISVDNMNLINTLNKLDKKISKKIHQLDHLIPTSILYPFASFFHPGLIWLAYLFIYYVSDYNLRFTALYAFATLVCVIITTLLKKVAKRPRPQLNTKVAKPHHFRKKQKNNAMPSGDAFQSAAFITFLSALGLNPYGLIIFHIGVCVGRVYYMCHWVADTLVSSVIGVLVAKMLLTLENSQILHLLPQNIL